jgi:hypothetical protein
MKVLAIVFIVWLILIFLSRSQRLSEWLEKLEKWNDKFDIKRK